MEDDELRTEPPDRYHANVMAAGGSGRPHILGNVGGAETYSATIEVSAQPSTKYCAPSCSWASWDAWVCWEWPGVGPTKYSSDDLTEGVIEVLDVSLQLEGNSVYGN